MQNGPSKLDSSRLVVSPATQLVTSPKASFKMYGTSLVSTAVHLAVTSPEAQLRGPSRNTCALKLSMIGHKSLSKSKIQSHGEVQRSSVLSDQLHYNMPKGYYGIFARWHQKLTACPSFDNKFSFFSTPWKIPTYLPLSLTLFILPQLTCVDLVLLIFNAFHPIPIHRFMTASHNHKKAS